MNTNDNLIKEICEILINKNLKMSVAESCTGGMICSDLISYPGVSSCFVEGCVTYSNESKIKRLNVGEDTLNKYGAVSDEVAKEMAIGIAKGFNCDIGLSTTGLAGPSGGTVDKPVGLVYIGIHINETTKAKKVILDGDRQQIREKATYIALTELKNELIKI